MHKSYAPVSKVKKAGHEMLTEKLILTIYNDYCTHGDSKEDSLPYANINNITLVFFINIVYKIESRSTGLCVDHIKCMLFHPKFIAICYKNKPFSVKKILSWK